MSRVNDAAEDAKKWRRDVGLRSPFSGTRPTIPRLLALAPLAAALIALAVCLPLSLRPLALRSCSIGLCAYLATTHLLPVIAEKIPRAKYGCDLLKRPPRLKIEMKDKTVPESLGLVSGVVFVLALVVADAIEDDSVVDAHTLAAATLAIALAILLGFVDDILDLEWRYKYALPPLMALPLLAAYSGGTVIRPPRIIRSWILAGSTVVDPLLQVVGGCIVPEGLGLLDLGYAYSVYMVLLVVFCTNAINIYAGVNGLECGQVYVIACAILVMSAIELGRAPNEHYAFSLVFLPPFVGTTLALLRSNWYPAKMFVGDTFTNYAGMALAVVAILGHFPIMLLLLMAPQVVNFLLSIPQLFKLRPCPRHRLPTFDERTGLLHFSLVNDRADLVPASEDGMNLTLINVVLRLRPMTEPALAATLLLLQAVVCALALFLRFGWAGGIY